MQEIHKKYIQHSFLWFSELLEIILNDESLGSERVRFVFDPSSELGTCAIYKCHGFSCVLQMNSSEDASFRLCIYEDSSLFWQGNRHRAIGQVLRIDLPVEWIHQNARLCNFHFLVGWIEKTREFLSRSSSKVAYGLREWQAFQNRVQERLDLIQDRDFQADFLKKEFNGLLILSREFSDLSLGVEKRMSRQVEIPLCELTLMELGKRDSGFAMAFDELLNSLIDELSLEYSRVA